jgi:DNA-directed RNA polymerase subunit RPC12/RpoP
LYSNLLSHEIPLQLFFFKLLRENFREESIDLNCTLATHRKEDESMSEETGEGLVYECVRCGAKVVTKELELRGGGIKCTFCGYRILKKIRPPVIKRVSTK